MSIIANFFRRQKHYKLNYITSPKFVQWFGRVVTLQKAWIVAISAVVNSILLLLRDWPFYELNTIWDLLFEISADIFMFGFFGVCSALSIGVFAWLLMLVVISFVVTSETYRQACMVDDWAYIESVLQEKAFCIIWVLIEVFWVSKMFEN